MDAQNTVVTFCSEVVSDVNTCRHSGAFCTNKNNSFFFFFKTCMQVYDHNLILDYVNQGHSQLSCMLLTSNDVP